VLGEADAPGDDRQLRLFTYNLVQLFYEFDLEGPGLRHDEIDLGASGRLSQTGLHLAGPKARSRPGISKNGHRPFLSPNPHPGGLPGTPGLNEVFGRRHRQGPIPVHGKRHQFFIRARAFLRAMPSPSGPPAITPYGGPQLPGTGVTPKPKTASSWAYNTAPFRSMGPVPPGIFSDGPRQGAGRDFLKERVGGEARGRNDIERHVVLYPPAKRGDLYAVAVKKQ